VNALETPRGVSFRRFFVVHLQKTAGTALWRRLSHEFEPSMLYPGPDDGRPPETVLSVSHLLERWRARHRQIRVVAGHFPLCTVELLGAPFTTLTVLRDPVERTLSFLRHARETDPGLADRSLEEIYEDPVRFTLVHNHMVKMLSLRVEEMTDGAMTNVDFDRHRLERAKERLSTIDAVGIQERFDEFCVDLTRRFGWDLGPPIFMNRTKPAAASAALRSRIAEDNALETELYEFARELVRASPPS
jgi:hypothetical protein